MYDPLLAVMWLGVKLNRTPRRFGQQSAKTLPTRGALQIEDLSVEDLHPYKNDPRIKNKQTNSAVSLPRPELRNLQTLRPYQHNARTHSKRQLEQIGRSIERFGFLNPVLIDASGTIIAGHGRVEAAKQLGLSRVPTLRIEHLSDAEKRAYILADNKLAQKAGWHRETLAIELQALVDMDFEIELTSQRSDVTCQKPTSRHACLHSIISPQPGMDHLAFSIFVTVNWPLMRSGTKRTRSPGFTPFSIAGSPARNTIVIPSFMSYFLSGPCLIVILPADSSIFVTWPFT